LDPPTRQATGFTSNESAWNMGCKVKYACRYIRLCIQVHNDISTLSQFNVEKKFSDFSHGSQFPCGGLKYTL